ncbi:MAG: hypothetical protein AB7O46_14530, partial [Xanthobacteraceae bacterium]
KPAIIRVSDLPKSLADQRDIHLVRNYADKHGISFDEAAQIIFVRAKKKNNPHSFRNFYQDTSNLSTYTFSSADLGTPASNRYIIVGAIGVGGSASAISSVTVGGVSAALVIAGTLQFASPIELWIASVPTGATGNIVVVFNSSESACGIGVWAAYLASPTAIDTGSGTTTFNDTLTSAAGGFAVAISMLNSAAGSTWTNITENYDNVVETSSQMSGASITTTGTSINVQRTPTASFNNATIAATFA